MRRKLLFFLCICPVFLAAQKQHSLHYKSVLVDTHNDVLSGSVLEGADISHRINVGHSDLDRWKEGGVDVQFFSVWTGDKQRTAEGFYHDAVQEIDSLDRLLLKNPSRMLLATHYSQVKKGIKQGKLVSLIGVEGGHMIEDDLSKLVSLSEMGMRYMTLTWNNSTSWASSAADESDSTKKLSHRGLTEFGKEVVKKMNQLGVIVDLSHTGEQTFYDALAVTTKPVLLSHSSVWSLCPVFRNVKDEQIKAVAKNGGVICINFYSGFISAKWDKRQRVLNGKQKEVMQKELLTQMDSTAMRKRWQTYYDSMLNAARPSIAELVDHIDYIVKLVGDDYVGIGSDYDGVGSLPVGMDDVTTYPKITDELLRRGYSNQSIKKILGLNVLRVMKANLPN